MSRHWFARRFPVGDPRNAMAPVSREGHLVAWAFVGAMALGAIGFGLFALANLFVVGMIFFVGIAAVAATAFILIASARGDTARTVADYRNKHAQS